MAIAVDFITLGDASERLGVPSATLRHWTDQMEEYEAHFVLRNNRNERIYYENDLEVFAFLRDLKNEYGRRTTTKDLAYMIMDKGREGQFKLRTKEEAPTPQPSNRTADLLNQEDIQRLMDSERVKQFISIIISENSKAMKEELVDEIRESVREEIRLEMQESNARIEEEVKKTNSLIEESINETRAERIKREEREAKEANKGFFAKLLGK